MIVIYAAVRFLGKGVKLSRCQKRASPEFVWGEVVYYSFINDAEQG